MFWDKKKSKRRSWEEISTPKNQAEAEVTQDEEVCDDECAVGDSGSENKREIDEVAVPKSREKLRRVSSEKIDKMIDNLELDPTIYYGWGDGKVDDAMRKATKVWGVIASIWWFLFGTITFAPVLFIASKLDKFFNDKKKSFFISLILYVVTIIALILLILF